MDPTTRLDPNRTMLTGSPGAVDPLRTQAMAAFDPQKTSAMAPMSGKALHTEITASRAATMANGPAREQFLVEFIAEGTVPSMVGVPSSGSSTRTPLNLCL